MNNKTKLNTIIGSAIYWVAIISRYFIIFLSAAIVLTFILAFAALVILAAILSPSAMAAAMCFAFLMLFVVLVGIKTFTWSGEIIQEHEQAADLPEENIPPGFNRDDEHPDHTRDDWRHDVVSGETNLRYWDWVSFCIEYESWNDTKSGK